MSALDTNQTTSVLLPAAGVTIFSRDPDSVAAAGMLSADWRFARVGVQVHEGGVDEAIGVYAEQDSPELLIVQTDVIDDGFTEKLEKLAGSCTEGTAAIVIGPDNDVNLYRKLIDMGVSDYLVKPLQGDVLGEVIAKTLIEKIGVSGSKLVVFVGAKGGVGTSALAQAAAWASADVLKQKTLFLDAAGGWSTSSVGLGFEPLTTLAEAVGAVENDDGDSLKRMVHSASERLSVLASGGEIMMEAGLSGGELERLLDYMMATYPAVVIDLSHASSNLMYTVLSKAHQIVVVSTASVSALRLTRSLMQEIKNLRGESASDVDLILNMQGMFGANEMPLNDIEKAMEMKPSAVIDFKPDIFTGCENDGQSLLQHKDGAKIVRDQILSVLGKSFHAESDGQSVESAPKSGVLDGFLSKIKAK